MKAARLRTWSELAPYRQIASPRVLRMLGDRGIGALVAVTPDLLGGIAEVVRAYRAEGVHIGVWPMLDDALGRWPNQRNALPFAAFVEEVMRELGDALPTELAVDLEPPIGAVRRVARGEVEALLHWLAPRDALHGPARIERLLVDLRQRGVATIAAVLPLVLADRDHRPAFERLLGTPVAGLSFDRVSPMLYTSLLEGYSLGVVGREDAKTLLALGARRAVLRYGTRASVSLGVVGDGILGNEQRYRDVRELEEDVAITRACGVRDLCLFDLAGVLDRDDPERWLDALASQRSTAERGTARGRGLAVLAASLSRAAALAYRIGPQRQ